MSHRSMLLIAAGTIIGAAIVLRLLSAMAGRPTGVETAGTPPSRQSTPAPQSPFASPNAFAAEVSRRVEIRPVDKFVQITSDEAAGRQYRLDVIYGQPPVSHLEVSTDTRRVARAALDALQAAGVHPSQEMVSLSVWGKMPGRGETGMSTVRLYGKTYYDFNSDSLRYEPFKR